MYRSPSRKHALTTYDRFCELYQARYPKACECLTKDRDVLFTYYDFPAIHWLHLRSTNQIESTFATVRHRTRQTKGCGSVNATMASSEYVPEDLPKRRTRLLNKADGKNRESENPEEISLPNGRNPTVALEHRGERFETENRQRGGGDGPSVCEYDRNDKTPKGLPHGVLR